MRIISKFYDYYDNACAYGIDPGTVYVRETREMTVAHGDPLWSLPPIVQCNSIRCTVSHILAGGVAFCGRFYPLYQVWLSNNGPLRTFHSVASLKEAIDSGSLAREMASAYGDEPYTRACVQQNIDALKDELGYERARKLGRYRWYRKNLSEIDDVVGMKVDVSVHESYNAPVIAVVPRQYDYRQDFTVHVNPRLGQYEFARVFDPVTAFQEISTFLGSAMAKQVDPTVDHPDELKAEIHGFDKWSFRKHKDDRKVK